MSGEGRSLRTGAIKRARVSGAAGALITLLLIASIGLAGCQMSGGGSLTTTTEGLEPPDFKITIPEGLSISQVAEKLTASTTIDGDEYERLAGDSSAFRIPPVGGEIIQPHDLEGLLFPSTYYVMAEDGPQTLIGLQLAAFSEKTANLPWDLARNLGVSPYDVVIVASLIEREVKIPSERAKVAAVIYNRLRLKMALGIDATIRFALKKWSGSLTARDLEVNSPYNTRKRRGLPPGPIASPGLAALRAALRPAKANYLYYVLVDKGGRHLFTSSYQEFLKAKQKTPPQ